MITELVLDEEIDINGLIFKKAFDIVNYNIENENQALLNSVGGVYAVTIEDDIVYIGSFSNTLQQRWINKQTNVNCTRVFRHFKGVQIAEMASSANTHASVYVLTLSDINRIFDNHIYINHQSIEPVLIDTIKPMLNVAHNRSKL